MLAVCRSQLPSAHPDLELVRPATSSPVGDSVDVTAGLVCTRGVIVGIGPNRLTISLAGAIEPDVRPRSRSPAPITTASPGAPSAPATCSSAPAASRSPSASAGSPSTAAPRASTPTAAPCRPSGKRVARSSSCAASSRWTCPSSGCRLSGIGAPPPAGANLRLDISGTTYGESQWLSAQVMRVETSAFGRYLLGLRFQLESPDDYARVLAWREASLRQVVHATARSSGRLRPAGRRPVG